MRLLSPSLALILLLPVSAPLAAEELSGVPVTVLSRRVIEMPGGSSVTFLRIQPPVFATPPPPPPFAPDAPLSPEMRAALERAEAKPFATLALTATVYTRPDDSVAVTKLTWREGERAFTAWSTVDWRLLRQLADVETETHRFQYFPFIDAQPLAELPADRQPAGLALFPSDAAPEPDALPEYYLEGGEAAAAATEPVLAALDRLHAHVHLHRAELVLEQVDLARRDAAAVEQARQAAEAAARPRHDKVFFWKIR